MLLCMCHCHQAPCFFSAHQFHFYSFFVSSQVPIEPQIAKHASLYHQVALVLLPWLLPGSEYLAHELIATIIFSKDFIS